MAECFARCGVVALVALLAPTIACGGLVTFVSQVRSATSSVIVNVVGNSDNDDNSAASDATGPFQGTAESTATATSGEFTITGHATATQDSLLSPALIRFSGFLETHADTTGSLGQEGFVFEASTESRMAARFVLPEKRTILVEGESSSSGEIDRNNFSAVLDLARAEDGETFDLRSPGERELDAGTYDLDFRFALSPATTVSPESTSVNFNVSVDLGQADVIPLPAGVWVGGAMLAGLAAHSLWRRFNRR
jgi:hypothetical protein